MLLKLLPLALFSVVSALGQDQTISFKKTSGVQLAGAGNGQILVSANDYWGVQRAAADLAIDFGRVTGKNLSFTADGATGAQPIYTWQAPTSDVNYTLGPKQQILGPEYSTTKDFKKTVIIAGTIGHSTVIDNLVKSNKVDVTKIKGKWESFISKVVKNPLPGVDKALVIVGSDLRGTVFGVSLGSNVLSSQVNELDI